MKTILITGINGYLGSKLAERYSKTYKVIGLEYDTDNLFRLAGFDFDVYASKKGIPDALFDTHKVDIIIHTATFYGRNNESNAQMTYANMYLPQMLLEKAIARGCSMFINTDTVLDRLTSSYALTKKQFHDWLEFYSLENKIKVVNLQLEHFYGPGTANTNFITLMVQKMLKNEAEIALTKAEQNRDFLYVDDLLRVYDIMLKNEDKFSSYETFNVGAGKNTNLKYILDYIKDKTESFSYLKYGAVPYRNNELMESDNDITKLKQLGWAASTSIEEGLNKVVAFEIKNR